MTEFAFATCAVGVEAALKREVARTRPELRFAYSRPGLVTFKSDCEVAVDDTPGTAFARVWGRSLGRAKSPEDAAHQLAAAQRFHAFARDDQETDLAPWQLAPDGPAQLAELVGDIIVAPDETWLGLHRHDDNHLPHPGGAIPVAVPPDAPSRAYAKIEEAIAWAHLPIEHGHVALEIGAAPGGAAMALARRGVEVWGVDPADMIAIPNVHHIQTKVGALRWEQLPPRVDWLLVDVNLAPQVALHEVARLMPPLRDTLRGAVITLKLNDWAFVDELPALVRRIEAMGLPRVRLRHLPSNRRELCAVALR